MGVLNRYEMQSVLDYLDQAILNTPPAGHANWCIRMARTRLLEAAVADITIEQMEAA